MRLPLASVPLPPQLLRRGQMHCGVLHAGSFVNEARALRLLTFAPMGRGIKRDKRWGRGRAEKEKKAERRGFFQSVGF